MQYDSLDDISLLGLHATSNIICIIICVIELIFFLVEKTIIKGGCTFVHHNLFIYFTFLINSLFFPLPFVPN